MVTIAKSCNCAMAVSYSVKFTFPGCSPPSFLPSRISLISARFSSLASISKRNWRIECCLLDNALLVSSARPTVSRCGDGGCGDVDFCVVSFYKFVSIEDPEAEVAKHQAFLQGRNVHGRIYVNEQGINAQYSGPREDALAYAYWLKEDSKFSDILVQASPALDGHAFPRLKLRYKTSLVQYEGGMSHLPVLDSTMRATPLTPAQWQKKLQASCNVVEISSRTSDPDNMRRLLLLDVRNGYEWDVGHFQGSERPDVDSFRHTSVGLSNDETVASDPLGGADKENTDILMYCTGGIRCDVYSTILRQRGFQNLYTLSGGISHYLKSEGSTGWVGNLFVFDSRLSLPPSSYNPKATISASSRLVPENNRFAKCYICRFQVLEFRHRNCANLDCNRLFLCCGTCLQEFRGCCCSECTEASRLRPILPGCQRYQKWHLYRDAKALSASQLPTSKEPQVP